MYDTLKEKNREGDMSKAMGGMMAIESFGRIVAPFLGSILIVSFTTDRFLPLVFLTIISVSIAFLLTFSLSEPKVKIIKEKRKNSFTLFKDGLLLLKNHTSLRRIVLLSTFTNPLIQYLFILYQPYFVKSRVPLVLFGLALSTGAVFSLLGNKYAHVFEKYFGVTRGILLATAIPGILYLIISFVYHPIVSFILICLIYLPLGFQDPLFTDYQNRHIESENRATVLSLISMLNNIYIAAMGIIIGFLADTSLHFAFLLMGGCILISAFLFRINKTHVER
jgi:MFS family permease